MLRNRQSTTNNLYQLGNEITRFAIRGLPGAYNIRVFEPDIMVYFVNDNQGLMNPHTGKIITLAKYGDISMVSKNVIRAEVNDLNNESVLLDRHGNEIEL